ncbi:MAG: YggT family protein, partial [Acidimicrobiales bacterium]
DSPVAVVRTFLVRITEPLMGPLRRALPPLRVGGFGLDLSPILVLVLVQWILGGLILNCG